MSETLIDFSTDLSDPAAIYTANTKVGSIYEIGLNGTGFMLWDRDMDEPELVYRRQTVPLDPQRLATTESPFSDAIERYSFFAYSDYRTGAGQRLLDREESIGNRYYSSDGVNPFEPGELVLGHSTTLVTNTYANVRSVVVGTRRFVQTAAAVLTYYDTPGAAATGTVTLPGAPTIESLATDGQYWYAACGTAGIFRGATSAPGASWSAIAGREIGWAGDRLCVALRAGTSTTANRFTTLAEDGTEEVASGRLTLDEGFTITNFTGGSGFVFFGAYAGSSGVVYRWNLTTDAPSAALELLHGSAPRQVFWYQGQVLVRTERRSTSSSASATIYRCPVDDNGKLTPFFVLTMSGDGDHGPGVFAADDKKVFFTWNSETSGGYDGIGALDITTGGYSRWLRAGSRSGSPVNRAITIWQGRVCISLDGIGSYVENLTGYETSGVLTTSLSDKASSLDKIFDFVTLVVKPLGSGESVLVEYTTDGGNSYVTLGTLTSAGATRVTYTLAKKGASIGLRLTLGGAGTSTPTVQLAQVRLHPHGLADTVVQLPVNCGNHVSGLNGSPLPENGPTAGSTRARTLEGLVQSRVLFQDIDYPITQTAEVFEVVSVDVRSYQLYDRALGRNAIHMVAVMILRKAAK